VTVVARWSVWSLAGGLLAVTAFGLLSRAWTDGRVGWVLDLMSHWPKHLALAGLAVGVVAGVRRMRIAAGLSALVVAVNGATVLGLGGYALPQAAPAEARLVRIVSANVHGAMPALEKIARLARTYNADVVAVYEAPDNLTLEQFGALFPDLAARTLPSARPNNGWPLIRRSGLAMRAAPDIAVTTYDGSHGVILRAALQGVQLITAHPPSPGDPGLKADRDRQLVDTSVGLDPDAPFIIAGDFNTTPWGNAYVSAPGTRAGDPRFEGTFPALLGPLGLPIDHIRFGGGLTLTDYRAGPDVGSDHLPLFATFALPPVRNAATH
jgi:endonuclease/exonuclease/phosphatase (EEP) superfamily protein YafD